jgi:hypothetical protein
MPRTCQQGKHKAQEEAHEDKFKKYIYINILYKSYQWSPTPQSKLIEMNESFTSSPLEKSADKYIAR